MKDYFVYFVVMLLGLGSAYWASLPSDEGGEEKVSIATISPNSIKNIEYISPKVTMNLYPRGNARDFWIDITKHSVVNNDKPKGVEKASDHDHHHGHDHGSNHDDKELQNNESTELAVAERADVNSSLLKREKFKASDKINDIIDGFNPFQGLRLIGQDMSEKELSEFGLTDSKDKIIVTNKDGEEFTYILGSKSYGSRNRFLLDSQSGKVMLVDGRPFESLERADFRLYERRLYSFNLDDVVAADIRANDQTTSLLHTSRNAKGELQWTNKDSATTSKSSYESWINKIHRLRLMNYQVDEVRAALKSSRPFLQISFEGKSGVLDELSFYSESYLQEPGTNSRKFYVFSKFLGEFAELSSNRMDPIKKDLATILDKS